MNDDPTRFSPPDDWTKLDQVDAAVTQFIDAFNADRPDGIHITRPRIQPITDGQGNPGMSIYVQFNDTSHPDEPYVGRAERRIFPSTGTLVAEALMIEPDYQGRGVGTQFQEQFEDFAAASGITTVEVHAEWSGKYQWMRAGYDWATGEQAVAVAYSLSRLTLSPEQQAIIRQIKAVGPAFSPDRDDYAAVTMPTPYEVAQVFSQSAIVNFAADWLGVKRLRTAVAATAGRDRQALLAGVQAAWDEWWPRYPSAAEGGYEEGAEEAWLELTEGLVAHASHDQSTHGNWARGATSRVPPEMLPIFEERLKMGLDTDLSPPAAVDVVRYVGRQGGDAPPVDLTAVQVDGFPTMFQAARLNARQRADMPQIPEEHIAGFADYLDGLNIGFQERVADPTVLKATQNEIDAVAVGDIIATIEAGGFHQRHPAWVSADGYILDGHHRWAAIGLLEAAGKPAPDLRIIQVDTTIHELLRHADRYNDIHEVEALAHGMALVWDDTIRRAVFFAAGCQDASCAPPPIGTGGSRSTGRRRAAPTLFNDQIGAVVTDEELAAARALADEKARNVPRPSREQIRRNARSIRNNPRPGGELRGSSYQRRARAEALFREFGGDERGYCPCVHCGLKLAPQGRDGHAPLQQDKILTVKEGGTYGTPRAFPNLIPACGPCNNERAETPYPVRPRWQDDR